MKYRILFVCLGNICRSPAAEAILKDMTARRGISHLFEIDSAGTYGGHAGSLPNPPMREAGTRRGYTMTHRSRQFTEEDFSRFDLILVMDRMNRRDVSAMGSADDRKKIVDMASFCTRHKTDLVPDPYGCGMETFEQTLDILEDACEGLLNHLEKEKLI